MSAIMAGALAQRALVKVTTTSHHEQWSRASFKNRDEEGHFYPNSLKIEIAR
jgi:hypothetical protein